MFSFITAVLTNAPKYNIYYQFVKCYCCVIGTNVVLVSTHRVFLSGVGLHVDEEISDDPQEYLNFDNYLNNY